MPRMPLDELEVLIANTIPDNTTGLISPADVRSMLLDVVQSLQASWAFMWGDHPNTPVVVPVTSTWTPLAGTALYTDEGLSDPAELSANRATGSLGVQFPDYVHYLSGNITVSGPSNRELSFALGHNGVPINGVVTETLGGVSKPLGVNSDATFIARTGWNLQLLVRWSDGGADANINVEHLRMEGSLQPTHTAN